MFDLSAKTILITGAAKGIGRQCATDLAKLGASVVLSDIDEAGADQTARSIAATGGRVSALAHDVTKADDWKRAVDRIASRHGRLDVLVNNAGIILNKPFALTGIEEFRRVQQVNVESIWLGTQAALPLMQKSASDTTGGSIVNFSSIYGIVAGPMHAAYCASKGAVRLLTKALAVEFARGPAKIRVNSVHPGPVDTDLGRSGIDDAVKAGLLPSLDQGMKLVAANFPMGRWVQTHDISGAVAFLAADASKFMTGAELVVDGGYTLL